MYSSVIQVFFLEHSIKKKFPMGDLLSFLMSVWQLKLPGSGHELESV